MFFWWRLFCQSLLLSKTLRLQQDLEDKKNEVIIEGLENKIKDHEAALEKKDFVLQTMEGSLAEAQAEISRLNSELSMCWGLILKCYELRTRQHKMLNVNVLRPLKHYFPKDLMNFGRRL
jgi:chromosome segregation ATPase